MMTIDEIIEVLKASKRGETIQSRRFPYESWQNATIWNFAELQFRIKPKPREWWAEVISNGELFGHADRASITKGGELIRVREVVE